MDAAKRKFSGDELGETEAKPHIGYIFKDGKLSKVTITCPIAIDYAEVGGGNPDKANKDAIAQVAALAEQHEEKHKACYEAAFKKWNADKVAKDLMAKTFKLLVAGFRRCQVGRARTIRRRPGIAAPMR